MRLFKSIYKYNNVVAGGLLFILAVIISCDILKRWIFGKPILGVFEISELILLIMTFLALGMVEDTDRQMRVDILSSHIKGIPAKVLKLFTSIIGMLFWGFLLWKGSSDWFAAYKLSDVRSGLVQIPLTLFYGGLIYGCFWIFVNLFNSIVDTIKHFADRNH